jgi:murein DD-endopeptidase MepM/ murein hydrolase activator NlpD
LDATLRVWVFGILASVGGPSIACSQPAPGSLALPIPGACISSPFGPRKLPGPHAAGFHNGIDLPAPVGAWVYPAAAGKVIQIRRLGAEGLEVDVAHDDGLGHRFVTRYAHLGVVAATLADGRRAVSLRDRLGRIGRSGITYGTHLHFELHVAGQAVDPEPFFVVARCTK